MVRPPVSRTTSKSKKTRPRVRGAGLIIVIVLILLVCIVGVVAYELQEIARVRRSLQRTADSVALGAALQLKPSIEEALATLDGGTVRIWQKPSCLLAVGTPQDPDPEATVDCQIRGWLRSKRAVFALLKVNPIAGYDAPLLVNSSSMTDGGLDACESPGSAYAPSQFSFRVGDEPNGLVIRIQRVIWSSPTSIVAVDPPAACESHPTDDQIAPPAFRLANGVQVNITFLRLNSMFARIIQAASSIQVSATSLAVPSNSS